MSGPGFYKRLGDGSVAYGPWVDGPGYSLSDPSQSADGWVWFPDEASAAAGVIAGSAVQDLIAQVEAASSWEDVREALLNTLSRLDG